ncbi:26S proteasome non-ATPase regulatory subunit 6 [Strongylocentrotus purpuratus]|uniref:26S proteasome non-ATPase regulatory subunit 6 n=1 Tax=Strongylocentrotus purpuratus TaxID=7668 RepID=A0A7M7SSG8_STRPU|nr:26S proteasome non-ATPase regulatory subunit 6 [Strongylocentrotus purpuratus]|eukprot:XP_795620.1 PREDICTED: 26S proteasome non-ATPase regulatory subunit 6 [Strongylocentrotus purpuratus]
MPSENFEDEGLQKNPDLQIAQLRFLLTLESHKNDKKTKDDLLAAIKKESMAPYYEEVCKELGWKVDAAVLKTMKEKNETDLKKLNETLEDAEQNLGETEVRDALLGKAEFFCRIGDKESCMTVFRKAFDKTVALGHRLDIIFHLIRVGLFWNDNDVITRNIAKAKSMIDEGGDWDRRNRLKVYQGVYNMSIREFKTSANFFLDTVSTFTSYELMEYKQFVKYTVITSMIALERTELRTKVVKGSEILEVLHSLPKLRTFLFSLYECRYGEFFQTLAEVEQEMKTDRLMAPHHRYYVREMRILAYTQLLESYRSLTLQYMADTFAVSVDFIDQELSRFIAAGRLHCKIDKVGGIVETNRPDSKNYQYQATIKQGDILLNRVQKLSRVINI